VGLPEAGLGLCPGWGGTNTLPARIDPKRAIEMTATGRPMKFDEAKEAGLFDAVAPSAGDLLETAKGWLAGAGRAERDGAPKKWIGRPYRAPDVISAVDVAEANLPESAAAQAVVRAVNEGLSSGWSAAIESEQSSLIKLRHTPESKEAIKAFFERSKK
jgi:enoyl-CoA hydratase/carnithine racemase